MKRTKRARRLACEDCGLEFDRESLRVDESGAQCEPCYMAWFKREALAAGIPRSVVEGRRRLSDVVSREQIEANLSGEAAESAQDARDQELIDAGRGHLIRRRL